ncbi:Retrovirus Polyprotein [Phytophthora megakarya]|uniref:Retrovirus Polyprotein n=1 Tax=Phytophthora megakarya TaxID=4795 RepID=A0A225UL45_9STRA|nr:Retrovirus Polyprotein [Phytophthora megakarya]
MQLGHEGRDRVDYCQSRQRKPAEGNYPVHDMEPLANTREVPSVLIRQHAVRGLYGPRVVTDGCEVSAHLATTGEIVVLLRGVQFRGRVQTRKVECRRGRVVATTGFYAVKTVDVNRNDVARTYTPSSSLLDEVKAACAHDADAKQPIEFLSAPSDKARRKLALRLRARQYRAVDDNAFHILVPNEPDLRSRIMYEYHDVPTAGHPGRDKMYSLLTRDFYWNHLYKRVCKYVLAMFASE